MISNSSWGSDDEPEKDIMWDQDLQIYFSDWKIGISIVSGVFLMYILRSVISEGFIWEVLNTYLSLLMQYILAGG